jgi:small subunit ribosomal protein S17
VPEAKKTAKKTTAKKTVRKTAAEKPAVRRAPAKAREAAVAARPSTSPAATAGAAPHRSRRKAKVGRVVSAKTPMTAIVEVERQRAHPLYKKVIRVRKRFPAHDANGDVKAGDIVRIQESRPFSATKRWQVIEVISRAGEAMAAAPEVADIERALEETEGVTELLAKPEREAVVAVAEGSEDAVEDKGEEDR